YWYHVFKPRIQQMRNSAGIGFLLVSIAENINILCDLFLLIQLLDDFYIISERRFEGHIVPKSFLYTKGEMGTLCAIAIIILAFIPMLFHGFGKHLLRLIDLHADLG